MQSWQLQLGCSSVAHPPAPRFYHLIVIIIVQHPLTSCRQQLPLAEKGFCLRLSTLSGLLNFYVQSTNFRRRDVMENTPRRCIWRTPVVQPRTGKVIGTVRSDSEFCPNIYFRCFTDPHNQWLLTIHIPKAHDTYYPLTPL